MEIIIATDLDRTLLPNGKEEYDNSLFSLFEMIKKNKWKFIYVSGRNLSLLKEAIKEYNIILPEYFISDVGTLIYKKIEDDLVLDNAWIKYLKKNAINWNRDLILKEINFKYGLRLQEDYFQNGYKLSYYLEKKEEKENVFFLIKKIFDKYNIEAELIYSIDPLKNNLGLIDIVPKIATKLSAIEFIRKRYLKIEKENIIYSGDSGNDILPLTFGYKSIVVKNAPREIKKEIKKIAEEKKIKDLIYFCSGNKKGNGNYSSGIIEGIEYFLNKLTY